MLGVAVREGSAQQIDGTQVLCRAAHGSLENAEMVFKEVTEHEMEQMKQAWMNNRRCSDSSGSQPGNSPLPKNEK